MAAGSSRGCGGVAHRGDRRLAVAVGENFKERGWTSGTFFFFRGATAGELAVAERAGSAFAEEVVAFGIDRAAGVKCADVGHAVFNVATAFEHERTIARRREEIAREQPRRPGVADDDGPMFGAEQCPSIGQSKLSPPVQRLDIATDQARADDAGFVARQFDLGGVDEVEIVDAGGRRRLFRRMRTRPASASRPTPSRCASLSGKANSGSSSSSRTLETLAAMESYNLRGWNGDNSPVAIRARSASECIGLNPSHSLCASGSYRDARSVRDRTETEEG